MVTGAAPAGGGLRLIVELGLAHARAEHLELDVAPAQVVQRGLQPLPDRRRPALGEHLGTNTAN